MTMHDDKRKRLEAKGWIVGTTTRFLGLTREESARIERRVKAQGPSNKPRRS